MEKEHYISFIAFATGEQGQQYPKWNLQTRLSKRKPRHVLMVRYKARPILSVYLIPSDTLQQCGLLH